MLAFVGEKQDNKTPLLPIDDLQFVLKGVGNNWQHLKNKKIFLTGGTGFFGKWLIGTFIWANRSLKLNAHLTVLTRNYQKFSKKHPDFINHSEIDYIEGDVRTFKFPKNTYDYLIHAASASAESKYFNEKPLERFDIIVEGTRHVLNFAVAKKISKLLYISSGYVYGKQPSNMPCIPENYPGSVALEDKNAALGIGKKTAEFLCLAFAEHFDFSINIARCFSFVGPYLQLNLHYAIGNFIRDALLNRPITIKGDGSPIRSYMYASDLSIWVWHILLKCKKVDIYNVGSPHAVSIKELAETVARVSLKDTPVLIKGKPTEHSRRNRYVPCVSKAKEEMELEIWTPLEEAIRKTLEFYQRHDLRKMK